MTNMFISLPDPERDVFVHIPRSFDVPYLERVISRSLARDVSVSGCRAANLCACNWGKVSCSGATVLRLSLTLSDGASLEMVAKILPPDPVNLFKIDCQFDCRLADVAWAKWWGQQGVPFVGAIYDTRADIESREFWILQECFPTVGWSDAVKLGAKDFTADENRLRCVYEHAADLHAHSRNRIADLLLIFDRGGIHQGHLCRTPDLLETLDSVCQDTRFCSLVGIPDVERRKLEGFCDAVQNRPSWVDQWDIVCVNHDIAPDNLGQRTREPSAECVTFDWGTAHLGPMELEIDLILRRTQGLPSARKAELLSDYLSSYARQTGRRIEQQGLVARMPWAWFLYHLRMIAEHMVSLRWVPHQTRSREAIRLFIGVCESAIEQCRTTA